MLRALTFYGFCGAIVRRCLERDLSHVDLSRSSYWRHLVVLDVSHLCVPEGRTKVSGLKAL